MRVIKRILERLLCRIGAHEPDWSDDNEHKNHCPRCGEHFICA